MSAFHPLKNGNEAECEQNRAGKHDNYVALCIFTLAVLMLVLMVMMMFVFMLVAMHYSITIAMQKGHIMVMVSMLLI